MGLEELNCFLGDVDVEKGRKCIFIETVVHCDWDFCVVDVGDENLALDFGIGNAVT